MNEITLTPGQQALKNELINWLNQSSFSYNESNILKVNACCVFLHEHKPQIKPSDIAAALIPYIGGQLKNAKNHYGKFSTEWFVDVMNSYYHWRRKGGEYTPAKYQVSDKSEQTEEERDKMNEHRLNELREEVNETGRLPIGGWVYLWNWLEERGREPYTGKYFQQFLDKAKHQIEFESKMERGALATEYFMKNLESRNADPVLTRAKVLALTEALKKGDV